MYLMSLALGVSLGRGCGFGRVGGLVMEDLGGTGLVKRTMAVCDGGDDDDGGGDGVDDDDG